MGRWDDTVSVTVRASGTGSVLSAIGQLPHEPNVRYVREYVDRVATRLR